ncbi:hypothetical protein [Thermoflexibacter ruber]|uniref:Tetratricopeptide repeat-containing protein n=1 Tax=Thermoflexibacter ruber TaxID=1003 RepID=A0A1I2BQ51_9BACT|nr:hypothetical protein [Thermoflexibacter ruber]SFE57360.1 hypothetical protein SAMN04488541_100379 [Thermoflexibacter ruber]
MMKRLLVITLLLVGAVSLSSAQPSNCNPAPTNCESGWCWGEDPGKAKETYTLFADAVKLKEYDRALEGYEWLEKNIPCLNEALYINALKMFEGLADAAKDANSKVAYQNKVIALYDKRMSIYGEKLDVMERKALLYYPYELDGKTNVDAGTVDKLYDFYNKFMEKAGANIKYPRIIVYYTDLMCKKKTISKTLNDEVILDKYGKITQMVDDKIKEGVKKEVWEEIKTAVDGLVELTVPMGCDYITKQLYPKLKENPNDIDMAKKIVAFILRIKEDEDKKTCFKGEVFTKAVETIYKVEKNANTARLLAERAWANDEEETFLKYINEAIELETDPGKKADDLLRLAKLANKQGKLSEARSLALKAATTEASKAAEAYSFIGDLYMSSYKQCSSGDAVQSRAVFLIAYDMYEKARDSKGMANAKAQFPTVTDGFTLGKKEGDVLSVGCWIGGTTTLRMRKSGQ